MEAGRRPVMADVAAKAGVSTMTVSRVLNGHRGVAEGTRRRVEAAVAELGYHAHTAARVLAGGRSRTLGVVAVETLHFGPARLLYGIEAAARAAGHLLSFVTLDPESGALPSLLAHLRGAHVEGIIVMAPVLPVVDALADLGPDLPIVVTGGDPDLALPTVAVDQVEGGCLATRHLLALGHATVHHVAGDEGWVDAEGRIDGWRQALTEAGAPPGRLLQGDWSSAGGYAAGLALAADPSVTAVFAANDQTALGVLRALREHGRDVPGDVSVVGFDDSPESGFLSPPLTTVRQDMGEVGRRAVELLLRRADDSGDPGPVLVEPELIVRDSTGEAPSRQARRPTTSPPDDCTGPPGS